MMWHEGYVDGGAWFLMGAVMIVVLVMAATAAYWVLRRHRALFAVVQRGPVAPWQIVDELYARGEITEEDYRRRRDLLAGH